MPNSHQIIGVVTAAVCSLPWIVKDIDWGPWAWVFAVTAFGIAMQRGPVHRGEHACEHGRHYWCSECGGAVEQEP